MYGETLDDKMEMHGIHIYRNTEGVDCILVTDEEGEGVVGGGGGGSTTTTKTVILNNGEVIEDVDVVIMAAGRSPIVESLGLEEVGVQQKDGGYIDMNKYSETTLEGVYAVGDVCVNMKLVCARTNELVVGLHVIGMGADFHRTPDNYGKSQN